MSALKLLSGKEACRAHVSTSSVGTAAKHVLIRRSEKGKELYKHSDISGQYTSRIRRSWLTVNLNKNKISRLHTHQRYPYRLAVNIAGRANATNLVFIVKMSAWVLFRLGSTECRRGVYTWPTIQGGFYSASCGKTVPTDIQLHSPPRTWVLLQQAAEYSAVLCKGWLWKIHFQSAFASCR